MTGLICIAGGKGSPGATTLSLALALALTRPDTDRVTLVDADPDGGDLAAMLGVPSNPGLVTLAAATRHAFVTGEFEHHIQPVSQNVDLLAAPSSPEQASASLTSLGPKFVEVSGRRHVVTDVGRWRPRSPAADLVHEADVTVLMVHPTVAGVSHARFQFDDLATRCARVVVACRGERPYGSNDVADAIGCDSVFVLPVDRAGAAAICRRSPDRWSQRTPIARAARTLGESLTFVTEVVS